MPGHRSVQLTFLMTNYRDFKFTMKDCQSARRASNQATVATIRWTLKYVAIQTFRSSTLYSAKTTTEVFRPLFIHGRAGLDTVFMIHNTHPLPLNWKNQQRNRLGRKRRGGVRVRNEIRRLSGASIPEETVFHSQVPWVVQGRKNRQALLHINLSTISDVKWNGPRTTMSMPSAREE